MIRFLEHRIGDRRVIRLIIKWLNAGVMEGTEWKDDLCGSPQGSVISPILANIYLHYVLDLWFDRNWRKQTAQGEAVLIRYADDFVAGFETRRDAEQFRSDLEQRLNKFGLALHPDKTRCIEFGRYAMANRRARGQRRPETFHFLGFTHYCRTTRKGRFGLGRKPQARRVRRTLKRIGLVLRRRRHDPPEEVAVWLRSVLGGWLRYFAVPTSHPYLSAFIASVKWLWFRQLRQRSQKRSILDLWKLVKELASSHFPALRIMHPWPNQIRGSVITVDALHTTRNTADAIVRTHGADYLFTVKGNAPETFETLKETNWERDAQRRSTDVPQKPLHGRWDTRSIECISPLDNLFTIPHVKQMFRVTRERKHVRSGKTSVEHAYGITSLSHEEASPERLLSLNRGHWAIENKNHRRRDTAFREDACLMRTGHGPANNTAFSNLALAIILTAGFDCVPAATDHFEWHRDDALKHVIAKHPRKT